MQHANRKRHTHPLRIPALLFICLLSGGGLSLVDGPIGWIGGVIALVPVVVVARAIRKAQRAG
jgi:hypothetical protein